jgi:uncharacterized membrane protein YbhN (UPF0104 family)
VIPRRLAALAGVALCALFVWLTFRRVEWHAVRAELAALPLWAFALALGLKAAAFGFMAARSRVLLGPLRPPGFWSVYRSLLLAFVGNNLLPLRAGELLRIGYLARRGGLPVASCLSAIALERTLDVLCLLGLCALVLPELLEALPPGSALWGLALLALAAAGLALVASRRPARALEWIARLLRPLPGHLARPLLARADELVRGLAALASGRAVLASLGWTLAFWLGMASGIAVWIAAFELSLPASAPLVVLLFVSLQALLPVPGQIGTYHYFAAAALGALGVEANRAVSFALVLHFMSFAPFTLIGIGVLAAEWSRGARRGLRRAYDPSA